MIAEVVTCIAMNGDCNSWGDHGGDKGDHGDQGDRGDCGINLSDSGEQGDKVSKGERSIGGYLVTATYKWPHHEKQICSPQTT